MPEPNRVTEYQLNSVTATFAAMRVSMRMRQITVMMMHNMAAFSS